LNSKLWGYKQQNKPKPHAQLFATTTPQTHTLIFSVVVGYNLAAIGRYNSIQHPLAALQKNKNRLYSKNFHWSVN